MEPGVVHLCYENHSDDDDDNREQDTDQHQLSPWLQHSGGWKTSVHSQLCDVSSEIVERYLNIIICTPWEWWGYCDKLWSCCQSYESCQQQTSQYEICGGSSIFNSAK